MVYRHINLLQILGNNRSALLFGPRGVGKTRLLHEFLREERSSLLLNLLETETFRRYRLEPAQYRKDILGVLNKNPGEILTVAVDEVQRVPEILDETHALLEDQKGRVRFVLTGSSARKIKRGGGNLLGGRALSLKLHPLCSFELKLDLERALSIGTLPAIYLDTGDVAPLLSAYVDTYLREEILQEAIVRQIEPFMRFLDVVGQTNGEPITFSTIARETGVSPHTVQSYYQILEDTLMGRLLPAFHRSVRKQLTQSPKFYLFDCGVINKLRGELRSELRPNSYRFGKLFETFLINELIRANDYRGGELRFSHWRTDRGLEVDLVASTPGKVPAFGIEIKAATAPDQSDLKGLKIFHEEYPEARCLILCRTPHQYKLGFVDVLPWEAGIDSILGAA